MAGGSEKESFGGFKRSSQVTLGDTRYIQYALYIITRESGR